MSRWMLSESRPHASIESIGAMLPKRVVTSADLMASTAHHTNIDLERLTGIHEHRVCGPDENSYTLSVGAAKDCLGRSRHPASDIELIIGASITRYVTGNAHRLEPALSLAIKEEIGASGAMSFDIANACAGMLTGVFLLCDFIRRGEIRCGMVVSGEDITGLGVNAARKIRHIWSPHLASLTLGDAGAAVIVERAPDGEPSIELAGFTTLAQHSRLCIGMPAPDAPGASMLTDARGIHRVAIADTPPLLDELLGQANLHLDDIDWLIPHQTSARAIEAGKQALLEHYGVVPKNVVVNVQSFGNTASTTHFVAMRRLLDEGRITAGERVMLLSLASGLEVGVVLFVVSDELVRAKESNDAH